MDAQQGDGSPQRVIAGFWRRLGALVIDLILLSIVGFMLGALFFGTLARMGLYARLVGFAIALAYFGILNSRIGGGQTLGQRLIGVRVVDGNGQLIPLPRALVRYAVLGIPFFANGVVFNPNVAQTPLGYLLALIVFGGIFAIVYLYIFNRRTRQSLHDLAMGSYVERVDPAAQPATFPVMWRGHLVALVVIAVIALSGPVVASRFEKSRVFAGMLPLFQTLSTQPHVMMAQVKRGWMSVNGHTTHSLQVVLRLDAPLTDDNIMAKHIAQQMAKGDPEIAKEDTVVVVLVYGYDMGIASGWKRHGYSFKLGELR